MKNTANKVTLALCLTLNLLAGTSATAKELSREDIISKCTATINNYAHFRDQLDAQRYANLFTEDAVFVFPGLELKGRDAIGKRISDNDGAILSRHLTASIAFLQNTMDADSDIHAVSYIYVFQAEKPQTSAPVPVTNYIVGEYHDVLRMTPSGCKFARREAKLIFTAKSE